MEGEGGERGCGILCMYIELWLLERKRGRGREGERERYRYNNDTVIWGGKQRGDS